jgi:hypothetical protein
LKKVNKWVRFAASQQSYLFFDHVFQGHLFLFVLILSFLFLGKDEARRQGMPVLTFGSTVGALPEPTILLRLNSIQEVLADLFVDSQATGGTRNLISNLQYRSL